jgi:hypothetical protein
MRGLLVLAIALPLGACAARATQEQIDSAGDASFACMQQRASSLDDHASDAITVAYALVAACNLEVTNAADTISQGKGLEIREYTQRRMNEASLKVATEVVLKERTSRAQSKAQ